MSKERRSVWRLLTKGYEGRKYVAPDKTEYLIKQDGSLRNTTNPRPRQRKKQRVRQRRLEREEAL